MSDEHEPPAKGGIDKDLATTFRESAFTRAVDEEQHRLRDLFDPPALRTLRQRLRDLLDPPILRGIREEQERLRDLVDPPVLRALREQQEHFRDLLNQPTLGGIHEEQQRFRDLVDPPALRALREQQEHFRDLLDPPTLRGIREEQQRFRDLVDPPALRALREQQERFDAFTAMANGSIAGATSFGRSTQLLGLGVGVIETALRLGQLASQADSAALARTGISTLATRVSEPVFQPVAHLVEAGVDFLDTPLEETPATLVGALPAEVFRAIDLDTNLRADVDDAPLSEREALAFATSDELEALLARRAPELNRLLAGARHAIRSDNPDKIRHVCISLRELLGHALRRLAPDTAVVAWTSDPAHFHKGKPTRRARLEYLYRRVVTDALRELIDADVRTTLELIDVLSEGSHVVRLGASAPALLLLQTRAEGTLLLLHRLEAYDNGGV